MSAFDEGIPKEGPAFYPGGGPAAGASPQSVRHVRGRPVRHGGGQGGGLWVMGIEEKIQAPFAQKIRAICDVYVQDFAQLCV